MTTHTIEIQPLTLPLVQRPSLQPLYPHQAVMLDQWNDYDGFLLTSGTGTGKTRAGLLPVLTKGRENCICIYPTNELISDQARALEELVKGLGYVVVGSEDGSSSGDADNDSQRLVRIVRLDATALDEHQRARRFRRRGDALADLLRTGPQTVVLTNPDILFLLLSLRYGGASFATIPQYGTLIVDEFYLYTGTELAHALYMLHMARDCKFFTKIVVLSATLPSDVVGYLDDILQPKHVAASAHARWPIIGERMACHAVTITPKPFGPATDVVEVAVTAVLEVAERLRDERHRTEPGFVPGVVILSSVVDAIRLEDILCTQGFDREELAIIRGLSDRSLRTIQGKLLVIGTSAIEVGVDFHCRYLIFEARTATSFMQRFGRVGRHEKGDAIVLCPNNVYQGMMSLTGSLTRQDLEDLVNQWYPPVETHGWFVETNNGLKTAYSMGYALLRRVDADRASSEEKECSAEIIKRVCRSYAKLLGVADARADAVEREYQRMRQGDPGSRWLATYVELDTFRTSLPSVWVYDIAEARRRGPDHAMYRADIATLLRRGKGLRFDPRKVAPNGGEGVICVDGYGPYQQVSVIGLTDSEHDLGIMNTTDDHPGITLRQAQHRTPISHLMALKNHVFTLVRDEPGARQDWRLPVFTCGDHLIAFDGGALLLAEIARRHTRSGAT
jgi:CRISPR-associated helicase Cas3